MKSVVIAPSILAADFADLRRDCTEVLEAGADWLHIDIMDGHFVPNLSLGVCVLKSLKRVLIKEAYYDVHLMVTDPYKWIEQFALSGASQITFHFESVNGSHEQAEKIADLICSYSCDAGISIKPDTPVENVFPLLKTGKFKTLLIMTVHPGFGGQSLIPSTLPKIAQARSHFPHLIIQVDGGITRENVKEVAAEGATAFVAGTSIFQAEDKKECIKGMRRAAEEATNHQQSS